MLVPNLSRIALVDDMVKNERTENTANGVLVWI